ncbi:MAG TPA: TetR/AcrR family transcriptional regulator [Actinomycetota bacterium]|nr:TetR/AcrR family transcriptional regulator [Actinomycetota bacterium]
MTGSGSVTTSARGRELVAAGRQLLEEEGPGALTMRRLADRVGIRAPSLYKHLPDKAALEAAIVATGLEEAAAAFEQAVEGADHRRGQRTGEDAGREPSEGGEGSGTGAGGGMGTVAGEAAGNGADAALSALATAYRRFALEHPHLYRLMNNGPLPREHLPPGLEERTAAPLLRAAGSQARARAVWAFAHGMVMLELDHRFPPDADLDTAWQAGIAAFQQG